LSFKTEYFLIWLPDRTEESMFTFIRVSLFLSSVQNMQPLSFGVMASFKILL